MYTVLHMQQCYQFDKGIKMTLMSMFSQMKLIFVSLRWCTRLDFCKEYIFFYVLAVFSEPELPTKEYIDSHPHPPLYKKADLHQMVAGLMLGVLQQEGSQSSNTKRVSHNITLLLAGFLSPCFMRILIYGRDGKISNLQKRFYTQGGFHLW